METPAPRKRYPSDVLDDEWAFVDPYLTLMTEDAPQRTHDLRDVFDGLRFIVRTGMHWRFMPYDLLPWPAVYQQTRRSVVERSFVWASRFRRLARDYERLQTTLEGFHYVAFALLALKTAPPCGADVTKCITGSRRCVVTALRGLGILADGAAGGRSDAGPTAPRCGAARRREPVMTIRHLRASITRLVLVGSMAAAVAAGGVALGPRHEAAAMTKYQFCEGLASSWWYNFNHGYYDKANAVAEAYAAFC